MALLFGLFGISFYLIYHFNGVAKEVVQISDVLGNYYHPYCSF